MNMQKVTAVHAPTTQHDIPLTRFDTTKAPNSSHASPVASSLGLKNSLFRNPRATEPYNPAIETAIAARFIAVEPYKSRPLRVRSRMILHNGVARRALHVAVLFGIITIVYQGISLLPAFAEMRSQ